MAARRLVLIRHAKAVQGGADDHARPLADRGRADSAAIGRWLSEADVMPDLVVVSTALRASETWELAATELASPPNVIDDARIYVNTVEVLLEIIHAVPDSIRTVALVGHNPSFAELATGLDDGAGDSDARATMARSYPTSGVACFDVAASWQDLALGAATLTSFVAPRG
jgi:phosphohistidine phosphatase